MNSVVQSILEKLYLGKFKSMYALFQHYMRIVYHKRAIIILVLSIISLSLYAGYLAFGPQSFSVLSHNQEIEKKLKDNIQSLQLENAMLQKKLFEIKGLEP